MWDPFMGLKGGWRWSVFQCSHYCIFWVTDHLLSNFSQGHLTQDPSTPLLHKASFLGLWRDQTIWIWVYLGRASALNWIAKLVDQVERSSLSIFYHGTPSSSACKFCKILMHWVLSPLAPAIGASASHITMIHQNLEIWRPNRPCDLASLVGDKLSHRPSKSVIVQ